MGDCNALDDAVVRDERSATGYAFRGSYNTAVKAYMRALTLVPSLEQAERGSIFARLADRVLFTEESKLRLGVGVGADTQRYAAFSSMPAETLSFEPAPFAQITRAPIHPRSERKAVAWAAETRRTLMKEWLNTFPRSADAQAAYAVALESSSAINGVGAPPAEALELARRSAMATDSADLRTYRWVTVVRLLVKTDSFEAARALSDSLLAATRTPTPFEAGYLGNLAALTGRARRAASLLRIAAADSNHVPFRDSNGRPLLLPLDLMGAVLELRAYASLDAPRDSLVAVSRRVNRLVERSVTAGRRPALMRRLLATPILLATPDLGVDGIAQLAGADDLLRMRAAIESRDLAAARAAGARFLALANSYSPGTVGPDRLLAFATMLLTLGDTTSATEQLDAALEGIPRARSILLEATPQGAVLGRVLLLRTQLALRAHDRPTARRWMSELNVLWRNADPEVRAPLEALRGQV